MVFETHHLDHVMVNKVLVPEYEDYPKYIVLSYLHSLFKNYNKFLLDQQCLALHLV